MHQRSVPAKAGTAADAGTLEATKNKEQKLIFRSLRANIEFLVFDFSFWVNGFHFGQAENINLF